MLTDDELDNRVVKSQLSKTFPNKVNIQYGLDVNKVKGVNNFPIENATDGFTSNAKKNVDSYMFHTNSKYDVKPSTHTSVGEIRPYYYDKQSPSHPKDTNTRYSGELTNIFGLPPDKTIVLENPTAQAMNLMGGQMTERKLRDHNWREEVHGDVDYEDFLRDSRVLEFMDDDVLRQPYRSRPPAPRPMEEAPVAPDTVATRRPHGTRAFPRPEPRGGRGRGGGRVAVAPAFPAPAPAPTRQRPRGPENQFMPRERPHAPIPAEREEQEPAPIYDPENPPPVRPDIIRPVPTPPRRHAPPPRRHAPPAGLNVVTPPAPPPRRGRPVIPADISVTPAPPAPRAIQVHIENMNAIDRAIAYEFLENEVMGGARDGRNQNNMAEESRIRLNKLLMDYGCRRIDGRIKNHAIFTSTFKDRIEEARRTYGGDFGDVDEAGDN